MTPDFRTALQQSTASELPALPHAMCRLFSELQSSAYTVSTEPFTSTMQWGSVYKQQDVHEFWTCLCERLESELKDHPMHKLIENLFQVGGPRRALATPSPVPLQISPRSHEARSPPLARAGQAARLRHLPPLRPHLAHRGSLPGPQARRAARGRQQALRPRPRPGLGRHRLPAVRDARRRPQPPRNARDARTRRRSTLTSPGRPWGRVLSLVFGLWVPGIFVCTSLVSLFLWCLCFFPLQLARPSSGSCWSKVRTGEESRIPELISRVHELPAPSRSPQRNYFDGAVR